MTDLTNLKSLSRGVYIHIPFCKRKCPYCDFYSVAASGLADDYVTALLREIKNVRQEPFVADTVYFGGGTPSLLSVNQIEKILNAIPVSEKAEISMELNPNSVISAGGEYLRNLKSAGVNRLSFGVQSFCNDELKTLGRLHDAESAVSAIEKAHRTGFENISADIMTAVPGQTFESLGKSFEILLKLPIKHISVYMLKIEENTPFYRDNEILSRLPDEDTTADMYLNAVQILENAGFSQYEISNFAVPSFECRHNMKYWLCKEYSGFGVSAHSFVNGRRYYCGMNLQDYISREETLYTVSESNAGGFEEAAMLALRLNKTGLDLKKYPDRAEKILNKAVLLKKNGFLDIEDAIVTLTPKGSLVSNRIISELIF